jgi:hypothetical protein
VSGSSTHHTPERPDTAGAGSAPDRVDLTALAALLGVATSTVHRWERERDTNGFPAPDQHRRWDRASATDWYAGHVSAKQANMGAVDRSGDPDELVGAAEAGRILGSTAKDPAATIRSYRGPRTAGYFPPPDGQIPSSGQRGPRQVEAWRRRTIWAFAARRTNHGGSGRPPGSPSRGPVEQDPHLPRVEQLLERQPRVSARIVAETFDLPRARAARLLAAARAALPHADHPALPAVRDQLAEDPELDSASVAASLALDPATAEAILSVARRAPAPRRRPLRPQPSAGSDSS